MENYVLKHKRTTLERAEKFISTHHFSDINLTSKLYSENSPLKGIYHYKAQDRISYEEALQGNFTETSIGKSFGPTWSTHWFRLDVEIPEEWIGKDVHLLWNTGSEATVWKDGKVSQGLSGENNRISYSLSNGPFKGELRQTIYIEMACNALFGAGNNGMINAPNPDMQYSLSQAEIALFNTDIFHLIRDVEMLHDMAKHLPENTERAYQALYTVNKVVNVCDVQDPSTYPLARDIAEQFFQQCNGEGQHTIHAMGHAHIDTAWLWPYAETIRKCARSWSCTLRLMEKYPSFTFTCSQAQQYQWVKEKYPDIYERIIHYVKNGQFVPVGGTWVEMDGNLPSGESFVRQFLYGQKFFQEEFNHTCKEFWLPDTFGYSGQLPQIMVHCGIQRFLTQKMSWSLVNKFPHHTFWWEGIDGSKVLTHFPPGDSYGMQGNIKEILYTISNYRDKGRSSRSVYLFGYGDGGNGPSEEMLQRLERVQDTAGLPRVEMSTPDRYFSEVETNDKKNLCKWQGELYLELHNGTYTSQAKVKEMNRKCEFLLHNLEFIASMSLVESLANQLKSIYPCDEIERLWKLVLLNQFHDVLPGSSIAMVYEDAHRHHSEVIAVANKLLGENFKYLMKQQGEVPKQLVFNMQGWDRTEVIVKGKAPPSIKKAGKGLGIEQIDSDGNELGIVKVPSYGYAETTYQHCEHPVSVHRDGRNYWLKNQHLNACFDHLGRVICLYVDGNDRNIINEDHPGNQFVLYDDVPLFWDAWDVMDYHLETRKALENVESELELVEEGPLRAMLKFSIKISEKSCIKQTISIDATSSFIRCNTQVDWHENRKFLKVEFPTSMRSMQATYEIQFGHLSRSTTFNTSWDWAQFEVCGHKWADLSEYDLGLAILNDSKYGYSCMDGVLRLSLLRAPKAPDADADMGSHNFTYAIMPHSGTFQSSQVIQAAYSLNSPLHLVSLPLKQGCPSRSFIQIEKPQVILETVKKAENADDQLILRLYEAYGGKTSTKIHLDFNIKDAFCCNGLENPFGNGGSPSSVHVQENNIILDFSPFQLITLKIQL